MSINPGTYNVFKEDGSLFKWGPDPTRVEMTTNHRVLFYIGGEMVPMKERRLPRGIRTLTQFDSYVLSIFESTLVLYATRLVQKLYKMQEAQEEILNALKFYQSVEAQEKFTLNYRMDKYRELNEFRETSETLIKEITEKLHALVPDMLYSVFTITYTES